MEKVVNSVNQIVTECKAMISQTEDCEFIDVRSLAKTLSEECDDLEKYYNEFPGNERELTLKKTRVEETAIKLEFYMDVRLGLYGERRKLRILAEKMFEDLSKVLYEKADTSNKEDIMYIGVRMKWVLRFLSRSNHIIFDKDEEDEKEILLVSDILKKEEKEYA